MPFRAQTVALLSGLLRLIFRWSSRDMTARTAERSCLVLAPHPDDEVFGCAATIMRKRDAGTPVTVAVFTDGRHSGGNLDHGTLVALRKAESLAACRIMGIEDGAVVHYEFEDGCLNKAGTALENAIADLVASCSPDEVFVTSSSDAHDDHAALGAAARNVLSGTGTRLVVYPIWQWNFPRSWPGTLAATGRPEKVSTGGGYLRRKREAVHTYRSQLSVKVGGDMEIDGLGPEFVGDFLRTEEIFLPVAPTPAPGSPRGRESTFRRLMTRLAARLGPTDAAAIPR